MKFFSTETCFLEGYSNFSKYFINIHITNIDKQTHLSFTFKWVLAFSFTAVLKNDKANVSAETQQNCLKLQSHVKNHNYTTERVTEFF